MSGLLAISSLGISASLYIYGVEAEIIPRDFRFIIILALMAAGVVIAYVGVRAGKTRADEDVAKVVSEVKALKAEIGDLSRAEGELKRTVAEALRLVSAKQT